MAGFGGLGTQGATVASVQAVQAALDTAEADIVAVAADVVDLETLTAGLSIPGAGRLLMTGQFEVTGSIKQNTLS